MENYLPNKDNKNKDNFSNLIKIITKNIIKETIELLHYNYDNHRDSFYEWFVTNSDYDFIYIYEMAFKKYFIDNFTVETERVLSYYSQNLVYAISSYYEMYRNLTDLDQYINIFITKQFEYIDQHQLYLNCI